LIGDRKIKDSESHDSNYPLHLLTSEIPFRYHITYFHTKLQPNVSPRFCILEVPGTNNALRFPSELNEEIGNSTVVLILTLPVSTINKYPTPCHGTLKICVIVTRHYKHLHFAYGKKSGTTKYFETPGGGWRTHRATACSSPGESHITAGSLFWLQNITNFSSYKCPKITSISRFVLVNYIVQCLTLHQITLHFEVMCV
jgi:hypothetical protein